MPRLDYLGGLLLRRPSRRLLFQVIISNRIVLVPREALLIRVFLRQHQLKLGHCQRRCFIPVHAEVAPRRADVVEGLKLVRRFA